MKKIGMIFVTFLFLVVSITGCKKDDNGKPEDPEPIVNLIPLGQVTYVGTPILVKWSVVGKVRSLTVTRNDTMISTKLVDSVLVSNITTNQKFEVNAISANGNLIQRFSEIVVPVQQPLPTISAHSKGTIPYDTEDTLFWSTTNATDVYYIFPGGVKMFLPTEGFLPMGKAKKDTTYLLYAQGVGGTVSTTIHTVVIPLTNTQKIAYKPWKFVQIDTAHNNNWGSIYLSECRRSSYLVFKENGDYEIYQGTIPCFPGQPNLIGNGTWQFVNNETQIVRDSNPDNILSINSLTLTTLNWQTLIPPEPMTQYREIYSH